MKPDSVARLRLLDLDVLDARELQRLLPQGSYKVEQKELRPGEHGDLGLTAAIVVVLAPPVLQAITSWVLKKRQRQSVVLTVEKIGPDNRTEKRSLEIKMSGSDAPQADVLQQIVSGMKLDPEMLAKLTAAGKAPDAS
jgi:hypothetical protein